MNKRSGLAPLIIVLIVASVVFGVIGGGVGGYRIVSKLREAKQAYEVGHQQEPAAEVSRETGTMSSTAQEANSAQEEKQVQKEMPAAKKETPKISTLPPINKTFELETKQQNIFARFEASGDWAWKEPFGTGWGFICRPQSRGYGCVSIMITRGAGGMTSEANARFEESKGYQPDTTLQETTIAGRYGYLWEDKYELAVDVPREYYLNPELYPNVQKKWVTDRTFYFLLSGFDFYATVKILGAFADQPEIVNTFDQIVKTSRLIDTSQPAAAEPPAPAPQRPVLQPMADEAWCPKSSAQPFVGEEGTSEILGVEQINVGLVSCGACHTKFTYNDGRITEDWSDRELWQMQNFSTKWACTRMIFNKTVISEMWPGKDGEPCYREKGVYINTMNASAEPARCE
ncbi:MAG: hypothetical protein AAB897_03170 [Patescibacteria group bacterium]